MAFNPSKFVEEATWESFNALTKPKLVDLAKYCEIQEVKASMRKQQIKNLLIDYFVDDEIFEEKYLDKKKEIHSSDDETLLKIKQLDLEILKLESEAKIESQKIQAEERVQLEKLALEKAKLNASSGSSHFDPTRHVRLVPPFQEKEVDKYFSYFEKVAENLKWPKEMWTTLLQSVFVGKAREVYSALPIDQTKNYDSVKIAVLKAYELVPEAYRQKFRQLKKDEAITHVEYMRLKEQHLDRWLTSKDIGENYAKLRELVLVEEFKRQIHPEIRTHLDESEVDGAHNAAVRADDYALTHKLGPSRKTFGQNNKSQGKNKGQGKTEETKGETKSSDDPSKHTNTNTGTGSGKSGSKSKLICYHCKQPGHVMSRCFKLKSGSQNRESKPVGCIMPAKVDEIPPQKVREQPIKAGNVQVGCEFEPFVTEGTVSLTSSDRPTEIKIARDTCCATSMILESVLPFGDNSYTGKDVLLQGIGMDTFTVPLHRVSLTSDLVTGDDNKYVTVGIRPELPIKGVHMLLGNDLAGVKVFPDPIVVHQPEMKLDDVEKNDIFPQCAVTRAMSKKLNACTGNDFSGLEDTFLTNVEESPLHVDIIDDEESSGVVSDPPRNCENDPLTHEKLVREQKCDPVTKKLAERALTPDEAEQLPICYYMNNGVLMRKYRPPNVAANEEWQVVHQIVVPRVYQNEVLSIAHDSPLSGHLGVAKTRDKIWNHFWWPTLKKDVSRYCKTCHVCQMTGKPNSHSSVTRVTVEEKSNFKCITSGKLAFLSFDLPPI